MNGPTRLYHGVAHLETLWKRHLQYCRKARLSDSGIKTLIACAIAFHDSVYDYMGADNEERSAKYWLRASAGSRLSEEDRQWVADTIRATADHLGYKSGATGSSKAARTRERARLWMLDLDLTPLGERPEIFAHNTQLLRSEAADMTDSQWNESLRKFYQRFLDAPNIYRFAELAEIFESQARRNLTSQAPDETGP